MDEIQNCIADAQYGEALRGMEKIRPLFKFPEPGAEFDVHEYAQQQRITLQTAVAEPLGSYFLSRFAGEGPQLEIFASLDGIRDFKRTADKDAKALVNRALKRLPMKFKRLNSYEMLTSFSEKTTELSIEGEGGDSEPPKEEEPAKRINEKALRELEGALIKEIENYWEPFTQDLLFERYVKLTWYCNQKIELNDFTIFRDLGRGAFGVVSGAKLNTTDSMVAIKCLNRKLVKGKKALKLVQAERDILALLGDKPSHFTIWLKYAWSDREMYFLALPLATGGDLMYHLQHQGYFEKERARFTAAEIASGLGHLHSLGIIYRDLKPENVLLDESGHARISDMGLAINAKGRKIKGRAGTPGYWAPEMLRKQRYQHEVDWWSFGCCLYEFLAGRCPFSKQNTKMERDEATLKWDLTFPEHIGFDDKEPFPEDAKAIISQLLVRDQTKRLGYGRNGFEAIKMHDYFKSIEWDKLEEAELSPPWVPKKEAINAVNQSELDEKNNEYDYRKLKLTEEDNIKDFSYVSKFAHQMDIIRVLQLEAEGQLEYLERPISPQCCCTIM